MTTSLPVIGFQSRQMTSISRAANPTATQYAGYKREIREATNCGSVRPQHDIRMTKPLMMKKSCTPIAPYAVTCHSCGKTRFTGLPHTGKPAKAV
jgi:hypothetical protein